MCCDVLLSGGCEGGGVVVGSGSGSEATGRDGRDVLAHLTTGSSSNVDSCAGRKTHGNVGLSSGAGGNGNCRGSGGSDDFELPCEADNCGVVVDCTASMHSDAVDVLQQVGGICSGCNQTICKLHVSSHAEETGCPNCSTPAELQLLGFQSFPTMFDYPDRDPRDAKLLAEVGRRKALAFNLSVVIQRRTISVGDASSRGSSGEHITDNEGAIDNSKRFAPF